MSVNTDKNGQHPVVGSLYFRTEIEEEKKVNVYRSRIRLVHGNGPEIACSKTPLKEWLLGDEKWYNNESGGECYGDLVKNMKETLLKAENKRVCEKYTKEDGENRKHKSRGIMILNGYNIEKEEIDKIYNIIYSYTGSSGKCTQDVIRKANGELLNYLCENNLLGYRNQKDRFMDIV